MNNDKTLANTRKFYIELFGAEVAEQYLPLARPGFTLVTAPDGEATGACRFGGAPLLEPGTSWPTCQDFPLSFLAVLDIDALRGWLGGLVPDGAGLVNFFYLNAQTATALDEAFDIDHALPMDDTGRGAIIQADPARAVATAAPERASVFDAFGWRAEPGVDFPDAPWDKALSGIEVDGHHWPAGFLMDKLRGVPRLPAGVLTHGRHTGSGRWDRDDSAFGWPYYTAGNTPIVPNGVDLDDYCQLLQLDGNDQWYIGGDGGSLHFCIPPKALREGDFSQAIALLSDSLHRAAPSTVPSQATESARKGADHGCTAAGPTPRTEPPKATRGGVAHHQYRERTRLQPSRADSVVTPFSAYVALPSAVRASL